MVLGFRCKGINGRVGIDEKTHSILTGRLDSGAKEAKQP
jgi:hypothetical protein